MVRFFRVIFTLFLIFLGTALLKERFNRFEEFILLKQRYQELLIKKADLTTRLELLVLQTDAFQHCGRETEYVARYDFGLKKADEVYVHQGTLLSESTSF